MRMEKELCQNCHVNPASELHPCPFQEEVRDNNNPEFCNCCDECTRECLWGI